MRANTLSGTGCDEKPSTACATATDGKNISISPTTRIISLFMRAKIMLFLNVFAHTNRNSLKDVIRKLALVAMRDKYAIFVSCFSWYWI